MDKLLRTRLTTVVVLVVVFGAGIATGLAADRFLLATPEDADARTENEDAPAPRRQALYEQVGPSAAQKVVIDSIVSEYRTAMRALHAEFRAAYDPRYQALLKETRGAIKGVLTAEQAHAYDSLVAARDSATAQRSRERGDQPPRDEEE